MEAENFYPAAYTGSQEFAQQQPHTDRATGLGAAADDHTEWGIDLNEQLIKNKPATFFLRVNSDVMIGAGIHKGDVVIVDRSLKPESGKIIIAVVEGELFIRRLIVINGKSYLHAADTATPPYEVTGNLKVWGVVTFAIHNV